MSSPSGSAPASCQWPCGWGCSWPQTDSTSLTAPSSPTAKRDEGQRSQQQVEDRWRVCGAERERAYLAVIVVLRRFEVFLDEYELHGDVEITRWTVRSLDLLHEVLHTDLWSHTHTLSIKQSTYLKEVWPWRSLTSGQVLLSQHLTDGGAVVLQLTDSLIRLLMFIIDIFLHTHRLTSITIK